MFIEYVSNLKKPALKSKSRPKTILGEGSPGFKNGKNAVDILRDNNIKIKNVIPYKDRIEIVLFENPLNFNLKILRGLDCEIKNGKIIQYFER